jgi:hypothetical protein
MGTWGVGVFADDTAAEVRAGWREALLDGCSDEDAERRVLDGYAAAKEADDEPVVWLALAAAQHETGRLSQNVREHALRIIESGVDLRRWEESAEASDVQARRRVLERLANKLRGPQPAPKKLRRPRPLITPFDVGDVLLINGKEGGRALCIVVGHHARDPSGKVDAVIEWLAWDGTTWPLDVPLDALPPLPASGVDRWSERDRNPWHIAARRSDPFTDETGTVVARGVPTPQPEAPVLVIGSWSAARAWISGRGREHVLRRAGLLP